MKRLLKNKKILFIIVIVIVLFLIMLQILSKDDKPLSELINSSQNQSISSIDSASLTPFPTYPGFVSITDDTLPAVPGDWVIGDNAKYKIKFPPHWKPAITNVVGNGTKVTLVPASSEYFPVFVIEEAPTNSNNLIEDRIAVLREFTPYNYSESRITFKGVPAVQVSEILTIEDKQGNPLDKTYIFFTKQDTTFVATFAYLRDAYADFNKQTLFQILNSIELK